MKKPTLLAVCITVTMAVFGSGVTFAGECRNNDWQPTFVRHNSVSPTVFYFTGRNFIPVSNPQEAQQLCRNQGVRMAINGQTCQQRPWGGFGCGCNITPSPNSTCNSFQSFLRGYESDALGRVWNEQESGWNGVWRRIGQSNKFNAEWSVPGQPRQKAKLVIKIRGNQVSVSRRQKSGTCNYTGILGSDMRTVTGTYRCSWASGTIPWSATIRR